MSQDEQDSSWYWQIVRSLATRPVAWGPGRGAPVGRAAAALRTPHTSPQHQRTDCFHPAAVTRADVEVQPYAFTTKSLYVGHTDYKYLRWQVRSCLCLVVLYLFVRLQVPALASAQLPVLGRADTLRLQARLCGAG